MRKLLTNKIILYLPLLIIMIISFFNMYNTRFINPIYNNHLNKQIIWYIIAIILFIIINKINTNILFKYSKYLYILCNILLLIVLIFGKSINGAKAWISLGIISFQPSEIMKLGIALYLSSYVSNYEINNRKDELLLIIKVLLIVITPSILVFLEPDTGAIIFYLIIAITVLYLKKINKKWFFLLFILSGILLTCFIILYICNQDLLIKLLGTSFFYRVERLITFKTENSYQLDNALIAIGAAKFFNFNLTGISIYIPEAPTDFIFAFNISNFGIISGIIILICYILINIFLINKYININDKKIKLFLSSFINIFLFHEIINIGMNLGLVPIIGIPLPFLSYGGSTIIIFSIFLSIIIKQTNNMDIY